jgi:WD40 repeat protein
MSPDGRSVAVGITVGARGQVVLWDTAKCERVGELQWPGEGARALAWSADGRRLAAGLAGGVDRGVDLWDPAARQAVRRIKAKLGTTTCVAFAPDHTTVAFATDWGIWKVARIDSGEVVRESHGPYFNLLLAPRPAFSADGQWLGYAAGVLDSHAVRVWRLEGPELPRVFDNAARTADWHDFAWSRDGRFLAYRAGAANLLYDVAAGRLVANREVPGTGMVPVLSPDGKLFAAGGEKLRIQDAVSGAPVQSFDVSGTPLGWSPDGTLLAVAGKAEILLVDSTTGAVVHRLTGLQVPATLFDWSGDGSLCAATALEAKQVCVWDARSGKLLQNLPHNGHCTLRLRRDGLQCVALQNGHYGNSIWQLPSGMLEREPAFANASARHGVSPDCRLVATTCGGVIRLEELATTKILRTLVTTPEGGSVIIGRTGHYLASPDAEKHLVYVVQTATGQETLTPEEFSKRYGWKNDPQQATGPLPYTPPAEPTPPAVPATPPKPPATSNLPLTPPPAIAPLDAQKAK